MTRLRVAGHDSFASKIVESAGAADDEKMAALTRAVDGITGGVLAKVAAPSPPSTVATVRTFGERWTSGELHRLYPDHVRAKRTGDEDAGRLEKWVYPVVGSVPLAEFTLDHAQEVLRRLPRALSGASRRHVAQSLHRIFALAVYPCRLLTASPLPRGFLPRLGPQKALTWLYPDEDARLLAATGIPLAHRMLYAFAHREGMREGEALSLTWADLDLGRGTVRLDENKTDDPRAWALGKDVATALSLWRTLVPSDAPNAPVFAGLTRTYVLAAMYREHLAAAGIDRPELTEKSKARRPIRFHDTRATFITVALATGRTEAWVMGRTGHTTSGQVNRYRRAAQTADEIGVAWFTPMHLAIPELVAAFAATHAATTSAATLRESHSTSGVHSQFPRMDSNHDKRNQNREFGDVARGEGTQAFEIVERVAVDGESSEGPVPREVAAIDGALARALDAASLAGRFDVVAQIAKELEARRLAREENVLPMVRRGVRR